jgi:hypothetical protein
MQTATEKAKHTPGPWAIRRQSGGLTVFATFVGGLTRSICQIN